MPCLRSPVPCIAFAALLASTAAGQTAPVVRVADDTVRNVESAHAAPATTTQNASAPVGVCGTLGVAHYGQAVPGGGTLASIAHGNAVSRAGLDGSGFFSAIDGTPRLLVGGGRDQGASAGQDEEDRRSEEDQIDHPTASRHHAHAGRVRTVSSRLRRQNLWRR